MTGEQDIRKKVAEEIRQAGWTYREGWSHQDTEHFLAAINVVTMGLARWQAQFQEEDA